MTKTQRNKCLVLLISSLIIGWFSFLTYQSMVNYGTQWYQAAILVSIFSLTAFGIVAITVSDSGDNSNNLESQKLQGENLPGHSNPPSPPFNFDTKYLLESVIAAIENGTATLNDYHHYERILTDIGTDLKPIYKILKDENISNWEEYIKKREQATSYQERRKTEVIITGTLVGIGLAAVAFKFPIPDSESKPDLK